jgi:hypothetical protein
VVVIVVVVVVVAGGKNKGKIEKKWCLTYMALGIKHFYEIVYVCV